jgi:hypothetical protein
MDIEHLASLRFLKIAAFFAKLQRRARMSAPADPSSCALANRLGTYRRQNGTRAASLRVGKTKIAANSYKIVLEAEV